MTEQLYVAEWTAPGRGITIMFAEICSEYPNPLHETFAPCMAGFHSPIADTLVGLRSRIQAARFHWQLMGGGNFPEEVHIRKRFGKSSGASRCGRIGEGRLRWLVSP